jgi:hypothetical protein
MAWRAWSVPCLARDALTAEERKRIEYADWAAQVEDAAARPGGLTGWEGLTR